MAKIIGDKIVNTKEDEGFIKQWLSRQPKMMLHNKRTNTSTLIPLAKTSTRLDQLLKEVV